MAPKAKPKKSNKKIEEAIAHHRASRLDEAKALCQAVLKRQAKQGDALHLLGIIAFQQNDPEAGLASIDAAIDCETNNAAFHNSRGLVLSKLDREAEAIAAFERVIAIAPRFALGFNRLGHLLAKRGERDNARALYREALALQPDNAQLAADVAQAEALPRHGGLSASTTHRAAAQAAPDELRACQRLAARADKVPAILAFRQLLIAYQDYAEAHRRFGDLLLELNRCDEAVARYRKSLDLNPVYAEAQTNLGVALHRLGRFEEACGAFDAVLDLAPGTVATHYNLGCALSDLGRYEQAVEQFSRTIDLDPEHASAHWNASSSLLALGRFAEGWSAYEWRFRSETVLDQIGRRQFEKPRWDGAALSGERVLVHCEQGVGDVIQMARYLPMIAGRGGMPILECQSELVTPVRGVRRRRGSDCPARGRRDQDAVRSLCPDHEPPRPVRHDAGNDPRRPALPFGATGTLGPLRIDYRCRRLSGRSRLGRPPVPSQR